MTHPLRTVRIAGWLIAAVVCCHATAARGEVRLPALFTDHMMLQRDLACPIWGWADPGEKVTVSIAGQTHSTTADSQGQWRVRLEPLAAGGPHEMVVAGTNTLRVADVLVGEVWVCSGQSNMAWTVRSSINADLETLTANYPQIRLISVPQVGTQEPQRDFRGSWQVCSPETVANFSAVGYYFGRDLHLALDVPVGLINNAWGGSACEAWVRRDLLAANEWCAPLLARWEQTESTYNHEQTLAAHEKRLAAWQEQAAAARAAGKPAPQRPLPPRDPLTGQHRPANLYNGVLKPIIGYGIRGAIWYQGESNAGRAYQYRELFPLMIQLWRDEWQQGDFPFYWVQLADFRAQRPDPAESDWAELREAQTLTLDKLPNTGEAVIIDLGEARDIHPRKKQEVGRRLARWALAKQYGIGVAHQSPRYRSMEQQGSKIVLKFDHVASDPRGGLRTLDVVEPLGFAIAGDDRRFVWAEARITARDTIEVSSPEVSHPVAVRYAWADNPVCNVYSQEELPLTPFRTDDWPGVTAEAR